jgi:hypothetical protein
MKKILFGFLLLIILFIGVGLGDETNLGKARIIKDKTEEFEGKIVDPNNDYSKNDSLNNPGLNNKIAKAGGNIIGKVFEFSFGILSDLIG